MNMSTRSLRRHPRSASSRSSSRRPVLGQRLLVWAGGRQRVVHVHDADDLRQQRDGVAAESVRVARAVKPFVVVAHDPAHARQRSKAAAESIADDRVLLHAVTLVGGQGGGFQEHRVGHPDLSEVVQESPVLEGGQFVTVETERAAERYRVRRQALAMPLRCTRRAPRSSRQV